MVSVTPSGGWVPAVIAGTHRHRALASACRASCSTERDGPFNVRRARQAAARDAHAHARAEGRPAVPRLRGAGRRHAGPEPAAVLPERGRVRHDGAGGDRGAELQQLPDAQLVRAARVAARAHHARRRLARRRRCARSCGRWATRWSSSRHLGADQRRSWSTARTARCWGGSSNHGEDYGIGW